MSDDPVIWDGNGGTLDPKTTSQRDLIVALHITLNRIVIPKLNDLDVRMRQQEYGDLTRGQQAAVRGMLQDDADKNVSRRQARMPTWAFGLAILALASSTALSIIALLLQQHGSVP